MSRFLPRSLAAQTALLLGLALLLAQLVSLALILNGRHELSRARSDTPAIVRFAETTRNLLDVPLGKRTSIAKDSSRRGARFALVSSPSIAEASRDGGLEESLAEALSNVGAPHSDVRASRAAASDRHAEHDRPQVNLAVRLADGSWVEGQLGTPPGDRFLIGRLVAATLVLYLLVLGAAIWGTRSINRPLRDLTAAAREFEGRSHAQLLEPRGPEDVRKAMEAFNAMNARILSLLEEKDILLGAIGHDLRTPLASLRIRVENMEPEDERQAAVSKIEEMAAMLESILVLARTGRGRAEMRPIDLTALAEVVTEEYRELGKQVAFTAEKRVVASTSPDLLRRALRNLIDNAVTYAGSAQICVTQLGDRAVIEVHDNGPGIPDHERERMLAPFQRMEVSRSRETGGTGLGLTIARNIAENMDGNLELAPNEPLGLIARLSFVASARPIQA